MLLMAVDIGSNSILATVARRKFEKLDIVEDQSFVTGLGRQIQKTNCFSSEAMSDSLLALQEIVEIAKRHKISIDQILITATEASRKASNSTQFFKSVYEQLGLTIKVITPTAEAYFAALGLTMSPKVTTFPCLELDIGGASTELTLLTQAPFKVLETISMPMGSVLATESPSIVTELLSRPQFLDFIKNKSSYKLWAISGSAITLAQYILNKQSYLDLEGEKINLLELIQLNKKLGLLDPSILEQKFGKRAKSISGGLNILESTLKALKIDDFYISNFGLRHGVLYQGAIPHGFTW